MKTRALLKIIVFTTALASCSRGPVREAVPHKQDYQQAYIYGFPTISAYKAMHQFSITQRRRTRAICPKI